MGSPLKLACLSLLLLAATAAQGGNTYCCQDANGRKVCGDSVPEQCRGKAFKVINSAGIVVKEVGPPLTAEQKAQAEAEAKRKKELEAAQQEQRRKDQALLATYNSVQDIDQALSRSEKSMLETVTQAEAKIAAIRKQRKKFEDEAEFYKKKTLPPDVEKGLRDTDFEIKSYTNIIDTKKAEFEQLRTKYDEDRRRYLELTGGTRAAR